MLDVRKKVECDEELRIEGCADLQCLMRTNSGYVEDDWITLRIKIEVNEAPRSGRSLTGSRRCVFCVSTSRKPWDSHMDRRKTVTVLSRVRARPNALLLAGYMSVCARPVLVITVEIDRKHAAPQYATKKPTVCTEYTDRYEHAETNGLDDELLN